MAKILFSNNCCPRLGAAISAVVLKVAPRVEKTRVPGVQKSLKFASCSCFATYIRKKYFLSRRKEIAFLTLLSL